MAKSALTAEQLDTIITSVLSKTLPEIMLKVLEKFENKLDNLIQNFEAKITQVNGEIHTLHTRMDALEAKIAPLLSTDLQHPLSTSTSVKADVAGIVEIASRALIAVEKEKEEIKSRARNVIVTGISPSQLVPDKELIEAFCEEHLTVKPRVVHTRRVGKDKAKMCITLESADAAEDLIQSSSLLRSAADSHLRRTYFNRDLTKQQADAAYERRCAARDKRLHSTSGTTVAPGLNHTAPPFRSDIH